MDESTARAIVRAASPIAKVGWWLWSDMRNAKESNSYGDHSIHWCAHCMMWASGFGEQAAPTGPIDEPNVLPFVTVRVHSCGRSCRYEPRTLQGAP